VIGWRDPLAMDLRALGRGIRAVRRRKGWRQGDLAAAAGVSRSQVGRIERGESGSLSLNTVRQLAEASGGSVDIVLRWQGEGLARLLDEDHARLVERVVGHLGDLGWVVAVEVSFSRFGERGSIDILAVNSARRALLVIEVKSVTPDMQAMLSGLDRKARLGPSIAKERGWDPVVVARVLVIGDTRTNRRRLGVHASTIAAALPAGTREVRRCLADPVAPGVAGVWFLSDVRRAARPGVGRHRVRIRAAAVNTPERRPATVVRGTKTVVPGADGSHEDADKGPSDGPLPASPAPIMHKGRPADR
jgi:transcriptional regulator with XRE-family HTH domain